MTGLFALGFTVPAVLGALLLLPAIWYLLRLIPPRPREVAFPPTRLLAEIIHEEETPNRSPWWLTLLRLLLAGALIIALAGPIWRPDAGTDSAASGSGPYWLIVDNGWAAAPWWKERQDLGLALIERAGDANRPVMLVATADGPAQGFVPVSAAEARARLQAMEPRSWAPDRASLVPALGEAAQKTPPGSATWLSDNLQDGTSKPFTEALAKWFGPRLALHFAPKLTPTVMRSTENGLKSLDVKLMRVATPLGTSGIVRALDQKGRELATAPFAFEDGEATATASFELPTELRNEIARVEIQDQPHAAAVQLLDERWRRRTIGLISGAVSDIDQPLLSPQHFLETALKPFADVREPRGADLNKSVEDLIKSNVSVIVTADVGTLVGQTEKDLGAWVEKGGVLIRFAGPKLAAIKGGDTLIPVDLRQGGRTLGGTLSWSKPQALGSFSSKGAFANLPVPTDVTVTRQVLAEQHPDLNGKTWASLTDGTPLVTAARRGAGWLVLFHVTADTTWSNLPLSGSFVEMLRRVIAFSVATAARADVPTDSTDAPKTFLPPLRTLDGYGRLVQPGGDAKPIPETGLSAPTSREHPPGLYGSEDGFVAFEPMRPNDTIAVLDTEPLKDATIHAYETATSTDLKPWVFGLAVLFLIFDTTAVLYLNGVFAMPRWARRATTAAVLLGLVVHGFSMVSAHPASAQATPPAAAQTKKSDDAFNLRAALATHLAYVVTGDASVDDVSRRGLEGLTRVLGDRTALEAADPIGVDPSRDELAFFPLLYWPVTANAAAPSPATLARIDAYMKGGGTILFDTRDALEQPVLNGTGRATPATAALRRILAGLDIPELEPVPGDHVLTKSFYLLQDFPGRFSGGQMWVEVTPPANPNDPSDRPVRPGDGVSPIIITSNDLAGAWAVTDGGDFLLPTVPSEPRQREMAFRVGVNIVIYTLTGNYKADQVHVPALLERLGQ